MVKLPCGIVSDSGDKSTSKEYGLVVVVVEKGWHVLFNVVLTQIRPELHVSPLQQG